MASSQRLLQLALALLPMAAESGPVASGAGLARPATQTLRLRLVPPAQTSVRLDQLSFAAVSALIEGVESDGELVLPLPFGGDSSFTPIEIRECEVTLDPARRTLVLGGSASVRGYGARVFLSGTFAGSGPGQYAYGLRPDKLRLGDWVPPLESTPLGPVVYEELGFVVASAPLKLPSSELIAAILGTKGTGEELEVKAGLSLRATLAVQTVPVLRQLLEGLGIEEAHLKLSGRIGSDVDLLVDADPKKPKPLEIELQSELEATAMAGLRSRLPLWIQPTSLAPRVEFTLEETKGKPTELGIALVFEANVALAGETRGFRLTSKLDTKVDFQGAGKTGGEGAKATTELKNAVVVIRGETVGDWERPLGIDWLTLKEAKLELKVDNTSPDAKQKTKGKEELTATLSSKIQIGTKTADLGLVVNTDKTDTSATFTTGLDSLTIGDLADFVSVCTGSSFLSDLDLGAAAQLAGMKLELAHTKQKNELTVTATAGIGGAQADVLFMASAASTGKGKSTATAAKDKKGSGKNDKIDALFAIRRRAGHLSDLLPALAGQPGDMEVPESIWTLSTLSAAGQSGALKKLSSADLKPTAREFFESVYGAGDFEVPLTPGIQIGASLPVSKMPPALVQALGIQDASASLLLRGSLDMSFNLGSGKPSAAVQALELHAELPRVSGAGSRLPPGLPAWMRADSSSQRTLTLRYAAPSSVTFLKTNDVLAELDGQTRHFQIATEISADAKQGSVAFSGRMVGEWKQPFGLRALNLRDVTLAMGATAQTGRGGARSGEVTLEGGFDLGAKSGLMQLEIAAVSGKGLSGSFTGTLDSLSLDDLPKLELFPNLPKEGLQRLRATLGSLPPLEEPTLHIALGGGQPSITLGARSQLRGVRSQLIAFVGKGPSGPQAVIGIRPENFTLAKLLPKLGENPAVAPLANLSLENFGLFAVLGDQTLKAADVEPQVREFFAGVTGDVNFDLKLTAGLNIEASFPPDRLPQEMAQAIARLNKTMGLDEPKSLSLRGTLAANPYDLRLAAALPPIRPARAPKWLKSGQLAIVLTGAPSMMLAATLVVDCEGDILNLIVEGGVERQGANVAIALKSALQADEVWTSPFGMEWLEIRRFSGQLSIDAIANIGFGGGGDVTIGTKDIKVFAWTKINAATGVPMGLVVNGESKTGVALLDLAELQGKMRTAARAGGPKLLPLNQLPDIALRDFALLIASRAVPEEGIDSAGFRLKGDLYLPLKPGASGTKMVAVDCGVSLEGIVAKGYLGAYTIGPLTWEDSYLDLEATLASQHLLAHGRVQFLGSSSETDLSFTREALSFEATREIQGLGRSNLLVEAKFDLRNPSFHARGQLDNEFGKAFGATAMGEVVDVGGKAALIGQAAIQALGNARNALEAIRKEAELPTALETIDAIALQRVKNAQAAADAHKRDMDAKYKAWQDTPASEPVKRKARELVWGQSKIAYDQGPMSKIKVLERRKAQYAEVHAGVAELERAKAENQRVQAALGNFLGQIAAYQGKTVVVTSASIESSFEGLLALKDGVKVNMRLDLLFCGQPKTVELPWIVGKPAQNAKTLVSALVPSVSQLVNG